jgi:hypothetical protein
MEMAFERHRHSPAPRLSVRLQSRCRSNACAKDSVKDFLSAAAHMRANENELSINRAAMPVEVKG